MDFHEMTREELIRFVEEIKEKRAFSEDDQYLLKILDESPFTIWASDRNCVVRFWKGKCESLYGYREDDVIGKDFVDLFVAVDEQKAAREDQLKIIDSGEVFHNIANDHAKNGNTLRLLTNCWRMKAPDSDEYWNVEMGLIVDFFHQEMERLEKIISESRLYKARITQFCDLTKQSRRQFIERKNNINDAIRACRRQAVLAKKSSEFTAKTERFKNTLKELEERLGNLIDEYLRLVQSSGSHSQCEELTDSFKEKYAELLGDFEDMAIDFEEIALSYTPDGIVMGKDSVLKQASIEFEKLYNVAYELKLEITHQIDRFKAQVSRNAASPHLQHYSRLLDQIEAAISLLRTVQNDVFKKIESAYNYQAVLDIRDHMCAEYSEIEKSIKEIDSALKKGSTV